MLVCSSCSVHVNRNLSCISSSRSGGAVDCLLHLITECVGFWSCSLSTYRLAILIWKLFLHGFVLSNFLLYFLLSIILFVWRGWGKYYSLLLRSGLGSHRFRLCWWIIKHALHVHFLILLLSEIPLCLVSKLLILKFNHDFNLFFLNRNTINLSVWCYVNHSAYFL